MTEANKHLRKATSSFVSNFMLYRQKHFVDLLPEKQKQKTSKKRPNNLSTIVRSTARHPDDDHHTFR